MARLHSTVYKLLSMFIKTQSDSPSEKLIPIISFSHYSILPYHRSTQNEEEYFVVFEFNSDVDCRISLLSTLPDSTELSDLRYSPGSGVKSSQHHLFSKGSEVIFTGTNFPLSPGEMDEESLTYDPDNGHDTFPLAILMETADGMKSHSHTVIFHSHTVIPRFPIPESVNTVYNRQIQ